MNQCIKKYNSKLCQHLCQKTEGCTRFAYVSNEYNGVHGTGIRQCCFMKSTSDENMVDMDGVIVGPKTCNGLLHE